MLIASRFQKRSMIGMSRTNGCGRFNMLRTRIGIASRLYIFGIQDHIESLRKDNTIKRGWAIDHEVVAQVLSDIAPKILNNFLKHICPNPNSSSRSHWYHLLRTHWDEPTHCHSKTLAIRFDQNGSRSHQDGLAKFLEWHCFTSESPSWNNRKFQNEVLP
jgi:hypothetical protein